jgi:YVTN family beta-propeller protein
MKTKQLFYLSTLALTITIASCKKNDPEPTPVTPVVIAETGGVFITNEGQYGSGTGTISYYNKADGTTSNDIFQVKNNYPLGNVVQSMELYNGKGYIVVNNASKVEVVDAATFASSGVITGLSYPRYFLGIDNTKGYVSEWGTGVKVINLGTNAVISTITTGSGAEGMVKSGNFVYVACSGGYGSDSVVTVINAITNAVVANINVGPNPKSIKVDVNGKVWVLCGGAYDANYALVKPGKLVRINTSTNTVDLSLPFALTSSPSNLVINSAKTTLYYSFSNKVFSQNIASTILNATAIINRNFYGLGIDPATNYFYGSDAGNFTANGKVIRYNASGVVIDSITVGVIPGNFCFK